MTKAEPVEQDTATRILDVAERLAQTRGFNGFSYADVASELDLSKAALHYHFAGKAELGEALITRYAARFADALNTIDARGGDAHAKLLAYGKLYTDVFQGERMCLCGMLAAEYRTLPEPVRTTMLRFFDENEAWLCSVLEEGRAAGTVHFSGQAEDVARMIVGGLEGAMLVARPYGDSGRFQSAVVYLLESLTGAVNPPA
jgi:TetR/AcrR family transcriptional repressor of nem operon